MITGGNSDIQKGQRTLEIISVQANIKEICFIFKFLYNIIQFKTKMITMYFDNTCISKRSYILQKGWEGEIEVYNFNVFILYVKY